MTASSDGQVFESVWDAIEDNPENAAEMRLRSELMIALQQAVAAWGLPQTEAAGRLNVTVARLDDLCRGLIDTFEVGSLMVLAQRAGLAVRVTVPDLAA